MPALRPGSRKYTGYCPDSKGKYKATSFPQLNGLPVGLVEAAVRAANNSLGNHSWETYQSVKPHLKMCQKVCGLRFKFPLTEDQVFIFVAYLLDLNLKSTTINTYLSGLRTWHLTRGHCVTNLRPDVIKALLSGKANQDAERDREEEGRLPVLVEHLALLRELLPDENLSDAEKAAFWCIAMLGFFGSFRICELLPKKARSIDPRVDLLRRDIEVLERKVGPTKKKLLRISLKSPKESKTNTEPIKVEVLGTGNAFCPVEAFLKYERLYGHLLGGNAAFRSGVSGSAISQNFFNKKLKKMFSPYISYGTLSGHSFRSGLTSLLGEAGFEDEEIRALGRWSSESFKRYVKLGRLKRLRNTEKLSAWVDNLFD